VRCCHRSAPAATPHCRPPVCVRATNSEPHRCRQAPHNNHLCPSALVPTASASAATQNPSPMPRQGPACQLLSPYFRRLPASTARAATACHDARGQALATKPPADKDSYPASALCRLPTHPISVCLVCSKCAYVHLPQRAPVPHLM
jgi:hypothetical protein